MEAAITVIGLGNMGSTLARLFIAAGHSTTVWNRTASKAEPLAEAGARVAPDEAAAVAASPVTLLCVARYDQVEAVLERAAAAGVLAERTIVNLTWGTGEDARSMAAWVKEHGASYLDGSIMGYPTDMGTSSSAVMYAGDRATFDQVEPLLGALSPTRYEGEDVAVPNVIGSAAGVVFYHVALGAFFEATAYASRYGVPPSALIDVMDDMLELLRRMFRDYVAHIESDSYETDQASNQIHLDAGRISQADMEQLGQSAALTATFCDLLEPLIAEGKGDWSIAALHDALRGADRAPAASDG